MKLSFLIAFLPALCLATETKVDGRSGTDVAAGARNLAGVFVASPVEKFRQAVASGAELQIYEGVPDPRTDPEGFRAAKERQDLIRVGESLFLPTPVVINATDRATIINVFATGKAFSPGEVPPCGTFHADHLLVWKASGAEWSALVALECQEVMAVGPGVSLRRYMPPDGYSILRRAFANHHPSHEQAASQTLRQPAWLAKP